MEDFIRTYKFPITGALIGFILALAFFNLGFFKTVVLILITVLGAYIGYYLQKGDFLKK